MNKKLRHNEILGRLDEIIKLLEFRNSIEKARFEMKTGVDYTLNPFGYSSDPPCTCHKKGKTSAVEVCPLHG